LIDCECNISLGIICTASGPWNGDGFRRRSTLSTTAGCKARSFSVGFAVPTAAVLEIEATIGSCSNGAGGTRATRPSTCEEFLEGLRFCDAPSLCEGIVALLGQVFG